MDQAKLIFTLHEISQKYKDKLMLSKKKLI